MGFSSTSAKTKGQEIALHIAALNMLINCLHNYTLRTVYDTQDCLLHKTIPLHRDYFQLQGTQELQALFINCFKIFI